MIPLEFQGFFQATAGVRLFYRGWKVPNPRAVCIVIHGLGEHSGRYQHVAHALGSRGFAVWAMDHRGHGRSEGRRGDCRSIEEFCGDLHLFVQEVRTQNPELPRIVIGHSLGGLIALEYAVRYPHELRAVVLSSPALRLATEPPRAKTLLAVSMARLLPRLSIPNGVEPSLLSRNPQVVRDYETDSLVHRVLTARCAVALRDAMAQAPSLASHLKIPCLILQGGSDRICDAGATAQFAADANGALVTFRRYDGLYHEVFNEPEHKGVIEDLCRWLEGILS